MKIMMEIVEHAGNIFLWLGSLIGIFIGVGLLLSPNLVRKVNDWSARWLSTDRLQEEIDRERSTDKFVYRHHRIFGAVILLASIYLLYVFLVGSVYRASTVKLGDFAYLMKSLAITFSLFGILGAVFGFVLFMRPSALKGLEERSNRWISTDFLLKFFNTTHSGLDGYLFKYRYLAGVFLIVSGVYVVWNLGRALFLA